MGDRYRNGRDRERDDNVEYFGAGESYRPGGHTGQGPYRPPNRQATDSWSSDRRDRDRDRDRDRGMDRDRDRDPRREEIDSYIPQTSARARPRSRSPSFRRRSRTPPARGRGDLFDDRPPRRPSPRREDRVRSPARRRSRSPASRRTPDSRRERGYSPDRQIPRARSPRRSSYRSKSRTPPRNDNWRRRSPSPRADSSVPSRRSSPPVHPDRVSSVPRSPAYNPRYDDTEMTDSYQPNGSSVAPNAPSRSSNGNYDRPPPSGPSRGYSQSSQGGPPTGPSMSAHNRGGPGMGAPTRPRGGGYGGGAPARDFTSPIRGRGSLTYRAPAAPRSTSYSDAPPSGPRAGGFGRGDYGSTRGAPAGYGAGRGYTNPGTEPSFPFRSSNNSTSTTYPRTQRFNTVQKELSSVEKVVPGGKLLPSGLSSEQEAKLKTLEAESERIRAELAEKQKVKREAVNEWEVRERESERESLRSELAEVHGDDGGMAAF